MERRETTKITNILCMDCQRAISILSGHTAIIISARCPDCKTKFDKNGEAYNKKIGYKPEPEQLYRKR